MRKRGGWRSVFGKCLRELGYLGTIVRWIQVSRSKNLLAFDGVAKRVNPLTDTTQIQP